MDVAHFVAKWKRVTLTETSASQQHFLDLCELFEHPKPAEADPHGETFTFEKGASKHGAGDGWADVWKKDYFGWEYKGKRKSLEAAYDQLLRYRESLENPPLLIVCDMDRIVVHTNFTNTKTEIHDIPLSDLASPRKIEIVRAAFNDPWKLKPGATSEAITSEVASRITSIAIALGERGFQPREVAHFLDRIVFALFAEDVGLLPKDLFTRILEGTKTEPARFVKLISQLFEAMANGGDFGLDRIRHFNGELFSTGPILELAKQELENLQAAARLDWSAVDPSIFGTLFERGMDPEKRAQLGAHYTGRDDIERLVDPVLMAPLTREWRDVKEEVSNLLETGKSKPTRRQRSPSTATLKRGLKQARLLLRDFHQRIASVTVLDPACGSGNFLYVAMQKLKDLEKEIIICAMDKTHVSFLPLVGPWQLFGIEINEYAHELAQMTVWIGYLQWTRKNGFGNLENPVLRPMNNFLCQDALLHFDNDCGVAEAEWPEVEFIIGNPPFLGNRLMRRELGDEYCRSLFRIFEKRLKGRPDLVCYWFEKAWTHIREGKCQRAGLLATQGIRGGTNRRVLEKIYDFGKIFFAESDRNWILDGASVHVSMVGFGGKNEPTLKLDGGEVRKINSDLSSGIDLTKAPLLPANKDFAFQGGIRWGPFDVDEEVAVSFLAEPLNTNGRPNSDVVFPYINAASFTKRRKPRWIIHFGDATSLESAADYEAPFEYVREVVLPYRQTVSQQGARDKWWLHWRTRPEMTDALAPLSRFIVTPRHSKHRFFTWLKNPVYPDSALIVFAYDDYFHFGLLHSRVHELWSRRKGTQVRERESGFRYTPTSCFETFPFPKASKEQALEISTASRNLDEARERWLNPPDLITTESLEFAGREDGPWAQFLDGSISGVAKVGWRRQVANSEDAREALNERGLTQLYNNMPTWLEVLHGRLDQLILEVYGWRSEPEDEEVLERLLELALNS